MNEHIKFDNLLRMAVREEYLEEVDSMPSERELEKLLHPSPSFVQTINKMLKKHDRREKAIQFKKIASRVAVIFLICVSLSFSTLLTAEAVRESIVTTVLEWHDEFTRIFVKCDDIPRTLPEIKLNYIPEGFELVEEESYTYKNIKILMFENENNQFLKLYLDINASIVNDNADNENYSYYVIRINDIDCIWLNFKNESAFISHLENISINISSNLPIEDIINIYKNIEIL